MSADAKCAADSDGMSADVRCTADIFCLGYDFISRHLVTCILDIDQNIEKSRLPESAKIISFAL